MERTISPEDVFWQLTSVNQRIARIEQLLELLPVLLIAQVDPTHLSIDSAAKIVGVSTKTIRRRIRARKLQLDVYAETRRSGIPIEQVVDGWLDLRVARAALARERASLERKTRIGDENGGKAGRFTVATEDRDSCHRNRISVARLLGCGKLGGKTLAN